MAWERPVLDLPGQTAGQDMSVGAGLAGPGGSGQFLFVKLSPDVDNAALVCDGHDDIPYGVSQGNSKAGDALQVRSLGVSKIVVGGADLKSGDEVGTDNLGRAVKVTPTATGANFGAFVLGVMQEAVSAGAIGTVNLDRKYRV